MCAAAGMQLICYTMQHTPQTHTHNCRLAASMCVTAGVGAGGGDIRGGQVRSGGVGRATDEWLFRIQNYANKCQSKQNGTVRCEKVAR